MKEGQVQDRTGPEFFIRHFKLKMTLNVRSGNVSQAVSHMRLEPQRETAVLVFGDVLGPLASVVLIPGDVGKGSKLFLGLHRLVGVEMFVLSSHGTQNPVQRLLMCS